QFRPAKRFRLLRRNRGGAKGFGTVAFQCNFAASRLSQLIVTGVHRHPREPTRKILVGTHLIDPSKELQKNILSEVFDIFTCAKTPADQQDYHRSKLIHDGLAIVSIARLHASMDLDVK